MNTVAEDAIALLLDLAERGEVNPWDVQVVDAIDRCLQELTPVAIDGHHRHLSRSGQAFLYAAMLVLLKADTLARSETEEENDEPEIEEFPEFDPEDSGPGLPQKLERQLRRRAVAPPPPKRRVSLQELIEQLQVMSNTLAEPRRPRRIRRQSKLEAARTIGDLAHQENLTETAQQLEQFLGDRWDDIAGNSEWVDFDRLLSVWHHSQNQTPITPHEQVGLFWALLLLCSQSKVELEQPEFYQAIRVKQIRLK